MAGRKKTACHFLFMPMEEWRKIEGYEDTYEISALGNVRNVNKGNGRRATISRGGYWTIGLHKDGNRKRFGIHRLVAIAFIPNPQNKKVVNHINGIDR